MTFIKGKYEINFYFLHDYNKIGRVTRISRSHLPVLKDYDGRVITIADIQ